MDNLPTVTGFHGAARAERIADGVVHLAGVTLAVVGCVLFIVFSSLHSTPAIVAAVSIYTGLLLFGLGASAIYHMVPLPGWRPTFRRIDHAAIYLKIAGTYTPIVVLIGTGFAYAVLAVVWFVALAGAVMKLAFWRMPGRLDPLIYLGLGWGALLLLPHLVATLPTGATLLIVTGGLLYSAGVLVFANWDRLRYSGALWHGIVLSASICFFAAITLGVFADIT